MKDEKYITCKGINRLSLETQNHREMKQPSQADKDVNIQQASSNQRFSRRMESITCL